MKLISLLISLMLALSPTISQAESSKGNKQGQEIPPCWDEPLTEIKKLKAQIRCFKLYTQCRGMRLYEYVRVKQSNTPKLDLTKETIRNAVESRLRSARLYNAIESSYITVSVTVTEFAFSTQLQFHKRLFDLSSKSSAWAVTWEDGQTGTHTNNSGFILSSISESIDRFLVDFLRVNEKACEWRSRQK